MDKPVSLDSFLMDRLVMREARSSTPTLSTPMVEKEKGKTLGFAQK